MQRITPYLLYEDVGGALDWLAKAFGFREYGTKMSDPDGKVRHAAMELDGSIIMMGCPGPDYKNPKRLGQVTQNLYVRVDDVDRHYEQALKAGATGYVLKRAPLPELIEAVRQIHRGESPMTGSIARRVVASFGRKPPENGERLTYLREAIAELPDRLRVVVEDYFFTERPMADIAEDLGVTDSRISQMRAEALSLLRDALNHELEPALVRPTGKAGGMLMFHGNLVHGSSGNITPYPRKIVYLTLNAVSNYIRTPTRPE